MKRGTYPIEKVKALLTLEVWNRHQAQDRAVTKVKHVEGEEQISEFERQLS